jgi:hypothetical protein
MRKPSPIKASPARATPVGHFSSVGLFGKAGSPGFPAGSHAGQGGQPIDHACGSRLFRGCEAEFPDPPLAQTAVARLAEVFDEAAMLRKKRADDGRPASGAGEPFGGLVLGLHRSLVGAEHVDFKLEIRVQCQPLQLGGGQSLGLAGQNHAGETVQVQGTP